MTVKELLERLQKCDPEREVILDDNSGGSYDLKAVNTFPDQGNCVYLEFDSDE